MNDNILVSIVVPVYNVEKHIAKCLDSLCQQTHKNIEIIVVDDGSPDNSADIIKNYADKDKRVGYVKRENGGLGAARNTGIQESQGEYICFVDSDDWVRNDYVEKLLNAAVGDRSDIVISNMKYVFANGAKKSRTPYIAKYEVVSNREALAREFVGAQYRFQAPNKFCRRSIFTENDIKFPEGKLYEDVFTTYKLILNASKISLIPEYLYYYLQDRSGSIMSTEVKPKRFEDMYEALEQILSNTSIAEMNLKDELQALYAVNLISLVNYIYPVYNKCSKEMMDKYKKYIFEDKNFNILNGVARNKQLRNIQKMRVLLIRNCFNIYCRFMRLVKCVAVKELQRCVSFSLRGGDI